MKFYNYTLHGGLNMYSVFLKKIMIQMPHNLCALFLQGFTESNVCFYQCHNKEAPKFKFLYVKKLWWKYICVQDKGRADINHFLRQS